MKSINPYKSAILLGFTLLFPFTLLFGQQRDIFKFELNETKPWLALDTVWKFNVGDHPDWAKTEFDDSSWQQINLLQDLYKLPQIPKQGEIVWFRMRLLNQGSQNSLLMLRIYQTGASEVYLNGELIHRLGVVSTNTDSVKYYNPKAKLLSFPLRHFGDQVLAIRFVNQSARYPIHSLLWKSNMIVSVVLNDHTFERDLIGTAESYNNGMLFVTGVISILGLLYLSFYLFFPSEKINLYFSIDCFLFSSVTALNFIVNTSHSFPAGLGAFSNALTTLCLLLYIFCCYKIFDIKFNWIFMSIFFFGLVNIPIFVFFAEGTFFILVALASYEILRVSIIALRRKRRGAWIILIGIIPPLIFWMVYPLATLGILNLPDIAIYIPYVFLSTPVSLAVFLGHSFGLTNQSLRQKVGEVEQLSNEKEKLLSEQNATLDKQVKERTAELNKSLDTLRSTQSQLIQSEKMASLGELTAGIAHEIQNPLNFINNFSEVNKELIGEMREEIERANYIEANLLSKNVEANQDKISHHGKRADAIVKGMPQHSRSSGGTKTPTDINKLVDEYLRLAYHGLRAKDNAFNVILKNDFDESIRTVNMVPQDIGRVILNLINNAFYTLYEKRKKTDPDYEPMVTVGTKKSGNAVLISVRDNGDGISQKVLDKIFQPFFTTNLQDKVPAWGCR